MDIHTPIPGETLNSPPPPQRAPTLSLKLNGMTVIDYSYYCYYYCKAFIIAQGAVPPTGAWPFAWVGRSFYVRASPSAGKTYHNIALPEKKKLVFFIVKKSKTSGIQGRVCYKVKGKSCSNCDKT